MEGRTTLTQIFDVPIQPFQAQADLIRVARGGPKVLLDQAMESWVILARGALRVLSRN